MFDFLAGRHRIQRVPVNDKKGRRQSSEVTVVILSPSASQERLDPRDVEIEVGRGSGPGGQHKNKTETLVRVLHRPTGITAKADGRSQHQNKERALRILAERVRESTEAVTHDRANTKRTLQMQGERAFTWTEWRDQVVNHRTKKKTKMSRALKGDLDLLR